MGQTKLGRIFSADITGALLVHLTSVKSFDAFGRVCQVWSIRQNIWSTSRWVWHTPNTISLTRIACLFGSNRPPAFDQASLEFGSGCCCVASYAAGVRPVV